MHSCSVYAIQCTGNTYFKQFSNLLPVKLLLSVILGFPTAPNPTRPTSPPNLVQVYVAHFLSVLVMSFITAMLRNDSLTLHHFHVFHMSIVILNIFVYLKYKTAFALWNHTFLFGDRSLSPLWNRI
jgi:hypothetical protein